MGDIYGIMLIVIGLLCFVNPHMFKYLKHLEDKANQLEVENQGPSIGFMFLISLIGVIALSFGIYTIVS